MKRFLLSLLFSISIAAISTSALAAKDKMYKWVDKQGVTHFTKDAPDPSEVGTAKKGSHPDADIINEKEDYLQKRKAKENQISRATDPERRNKLKRELLVIDYNWYKDRDPEKAAQIKAKLGEPKVRVIKKKEEESNMDKYKAFY